MLVRLFLSLALAATARAAEVPFRFVVVGDTGSGSAWQFKVAEQMWRWRETNPFKLVLMLGDNIYGNTELTHGGDPRLFPAKFDRQYKRFQDAGVDFHAAMGNHDRQWHKGQGEIDDVARFGMLGKDAYYKISTPPEYDVDGKPLAEFFAINSELKDQKFAEQAEWLKKALKESNAVWKFVYLHHPLYTISGQHSPAVELRNAIIGSMKANHVQFVLAGHNHFYARMKPVDHLVQVITGGGGRHLAFPRMDHCAEFSARKYHFLGVEVFHDRVGFVAIDYTGKILDDATIAMTDLEHNAAGCPMR